jgi:hypothetical protein
VDGLERLQLHTAFIRRVARKKQKDCVFHTLRCAYLLVQVVVLRGFEVGPRLHIQHCLALVATVNLTFEFSHLRIQAAGSRRLLRHVCNQRAYESPPPLTLQCHA